MNSTYDLLFAVHVTCVTASIAFFVVRGGWMLAGSERLQQRWVRIVPHVVDTALLASAIGLFVLIGNVPGTHAWLAAKVVGLVAYIVLGTIALKRGRTQGIRLAAFVGAIAVFAYIASVAVTKSPAGFFAWM